MKLWTDVADVQPDPQAEEQSGEGEGAIGDPGPQPDDGDPPDAPDPGADGLVLPDGVADTGADPTSDAEVPLPDPAPDAPADGQPPPDATPTGDTDGADGTDASDALVQCTANEDCDDGLRCTENWCDENGFCAQIPSLCTDNNQCTKDLCDEVDGCYHVQTWSWDCDDGNACTENDHCDYTGWCTGTKKVKCDDGNPCTDDECHPIKGCVFTPHERECQDGLFCTWQDKCSDGKCISGPPRPCPTGTPCVVGTCNEKYDRCDYEAVPDIPCDDESACTTNDTCRWDGACQGVRIECPDDGNICTRHECDPKTGICKMLLNQHLPCDDGNACTVFDECWDTKCRSLFPKFCAKDGEQLIPCVTGRGCDPAKGCQFEVSEDCDCHGDHDECAWAVTPYCCLFNEEKGGYRCKHVLDQLTECYPPPP